jgi:hypothetical protein
MGTKTLVDFRYMQFLLAKPESPTPFEVPMLPETKTTCSRPAAIGATGAVGVAFIAWIADLVVGVITDAVNTKAAAYSSVRAATTGYGNFFDANLWEDVDGNKLSCFVAVKAICEPTPDAKGACPGDAFQKSPRLIVVGQYRRTADSLQIRPLEVWIKGLDTPKDALNKPATLAITWEAENLWREGASGHSKLIPAAPIFAAEFTAQAAGTHLLKGPPKVECPATGVCPAGQEWLAATTVEIPSESNPVGATGPVAMLNVKVVAAEISSPPAALKAFAKFLGAKGDDVSTALSDAMKRALKMD